MKLSFSTRGWENMSFEQWMDTAIDMKFDGIEIHNLNKFPALTERGGAFHKYNMAASARTLREKGLS
ncbi:MAG: hypothetical protein IKU12_06155, partial [Oscillospiraceae bacterium]|nr:hypothetical protein [Oscillospiraceae bacterium]